MPVSVSSSTDPATGISKVHVAMCDSPVPVWVVVNQIGDNRSWLKPGSIQQDDRFFGFTVAGGCHPESARLAVTALIGSIESRPEYRNKAVLRDKPAAPGPRPMGTPGPRRSASLPVAERTRVEDSAPTPVAHAPEAPAKPADQLDRVLELLAAALDENPSRSLSVNVSPKGKLSFYLSPVRG